MTDLAKLPNLGPTLCERLAEVGIDDAQALKQIGPANAYVRMVHVTGRSLPVCYYLYSLEGALRGEDWRCLSDHEKQRLRSEAGLPLGRKRKPPRERTKSGPQQRSRG
ncbi:MAG: TfoX/Sxy family DNA transformation protein [Polyangiaceae bacterium]|nr:TfoX/Sxy family DNA transformation protein [Polyangiaceae bacterium]